MMSEIKQIESIINPTETFLVADSLTGQVAAEVAKEFKSTVNLTGIILTRADGDARGGAALSMKFKTGCPIKFMGTGELIDDLESFTYMTTNDGQVSLRAQVGGTIGDIYGAVWDTDDSGQNLIREDGRPTASSPDKYLGTAQPDFLAGWSNTIRYGNYSLSFQIDGRFGGQFYSNTSRNLDVIGGSERSAQYRESGITLTGVNTSTGVANTEPITAQEYWGSLAVENYIYDQDNIRLRELSIGYQIPNTIDYGIQSASLQLIGRNLFFFSKDAPDVDPEMTLGTAIGAQGFNLNNLPSTRSLGLNLTLNF